MSKIRIKKGDQVEVISGKDKGKKGEIIKILNSSSRVIVEGVNIIQGIWSSNHTDESNGNLDGALSCDGIVQVDWFFEWNIVGNRILTTTHSDNIHWQQPEDVKIPLGVVPDCSAICPKCGC